MKKVYESSSACKLAKGSVEGFWRRYLACHGRKICASNDSARSEYFLPLEGPAGAEECDFSLAALCKLADDDRYEDHNSKGKRQ